MLDTKATLLWRAVEAAILSGATGVLAYLSVESSESGALAWAALCLALVALLASFLAVWRTTGLEAIRGTIWGVDGEGGILRKHRSFEYEVKRQLEEHRERMEKRLEKQDDDIVERSHALREKLAVDIAGLRDPVARLAELSCADRRCGYCMRCQFDKEIKPQMRAVVEHRKMLRFFAKWMEEQGAKVPFTFATEPEEEPRRGR